MSRSTVSQILNGRGAAFAEETRERVHRAVEELGYQPSAAGRTLARGSSDIVVALIPNTTFGGNLQDVFESLTEQLSQRGLTLVLRLATDTPESLDRLLISMKPRAVLSLAPLSTAERAVVESRAVTLISPDIAAGSDANADIGRLQASYLIKHGYRRLAFAHLRDARSDPFGAPREKAFLAECREHAVQETRVLGLGIDPEQADAALDDLGGTGFAIACYNDDVAIALLHAATRRGWSIPRDLALLGMDHTPLSRVTTPPLTTMEVDMEWSTESSVRQILARVDGQELPPAIGTLPLRVVQGGSI